MSAATPVPGLDDPLADGFPALFAALDDDDHRNDDAGHGGDRAPAARGCAWLGVLALGSPDAVAPAVPALAARLFDRRVPLARRLALASAVACVSASLTGELVDRLLSGCDDDRAVAARALAGPHHLAAVPALLRVARDVAADARARVAAVDALAAVGDRSALSAVAALLADDHRAVRRAAVVALRVLDPSPRRAGDFARAAADLDVDVRCAALAALLAVGGPAARTAARAALADDAAAVRALAVVTLARHGTARDAARVRACAADADQRVRRAVREAAAC